MSNERLAVSIAELSDLDVRELDAFLRRRAPTLLEAMSSDDASVKVGVLTRVAPRVVPTIAGLYAFGRAPHLVFPEWAIACVAFDGTRITDAIREQREVGGPLSAMVDGAVAFVRDCSGTTADEYAEPLVRELIVNAVVHRELRKPTRIAVRVFTDRVEIASPGGLTEGSPEIDEMAREGGVSIARNPLVAAFARHFGYGEHLGRGLALIQNASTPSWRAEIRVSPRDVVAILPSKWDRPASLS